MADYRSLLDEWYALTVSEDTAPVLNLPPEMTTTINQAKSQSDRAVSPIAVEAAEKRAREVVQQLFVWWMEDRSAPSHLPNSLHTRTGLALVEM